MGEICAADEVIWSGDGSDAADLMRATMDDDSVAFAHLVRACPERGGLVAQFGMLARDRVTLLHKLGAIQLRQITHRRRTKGNGISFHVGAPIGDIHAPAMRG